MKSSHLGGLCSEDEEEEMGRIPSASAGLRSDDWTVPPVFPTLSQEIPSAATARAGTLTELKTTGVSLAKAASKKRPRRELVVDACGPDGDPAPPSRAAAAARKQRDKEEKALVALSRRIERGDFRSMELQPMWILASTLTGGEGARPGLERALRAAERPLAGHARMISGNRLQDCSASESSEANSFGLDALCFVRSRLVPNCAATDVAREAAAEARRVEPIAILVLSGDAALRMVAENSFESCVKTAYYRFRDCVERLDPDASGARCVLALLSLEAALFGHLRADPEIQGKLSQSLSNLGLEIGLNTLQRLNTDQALIDQILGHLRALEDAPYGDEGAPPSALHTLKRHKTFKSSSKSSKEIDGLQLSQVWVNALRCVPRMSREMAHNAAGSFPTFRQAFHALHEDAGRATGELETVAREGKTKQAKLARMVRVLMTSEEPDSRLDGSDEPSHV